MASSSGLTRRRGGKTQEVDGNSSLTSQPKDNSTTYENSENGHKIVSDPKDILEHVEYSKQPKLTLMEEVLLMGLKDKQGYLSFWNDQISYALRGCIVMELAFRGKIRMQKFVGQRAPPLRDRCIELVDEQITGEVLLDEALKMMKTSEKMCVADWIDLMSGETWNLMKIGYQLKQVRERLAKGLVDKGILSTEKKNFLFFDMATHPLVDSTAKDDIRQRVRNFLTKKHVDLPSSPFLPSELPLRYFRTLTMICAAYAANVLENVLTNLEPESREKSFSQVDDFLKSYSQWPFSKPKQTNPDIGQNIWQAISNEVSDANGENEKDLQLQVIVACLSVFGELDSLL